MSVFFLGISRQVGGLGVQKPAKHFFIIQAKISHTGSSESMFCFIFHCPRNCTCKRQKFPA